MLPSEAVAEKVVEGIRSSQSRAHVGSTSNLKSPLSCKVQRSSSLRVKSRGEGPGTERRDWPAAPHAGAVSIAASAGVGQSPRQHVGGGSRCGLQVPACPRRGRDGGEPRRGRPSPAPVSAVVLGRGGAGLPGLSAVARGCGAGVAATIGGEAGGAGPGGIAAGRAERAQAGCRLGKLGWCICVPAWPWQRRPSKCASWAQGTGELRRIGGVGSASGKPFCRAGRAARPRRGVGTGHRAQGGRAGSLSAGQGTVHRAPGRPERPRGGFAREALGPRVCGGRRADRVLCAPGHLSALGSCAARAARPPAPPARVF